MEIRRLTANLRRELKSPLGLLIKGSLETTTRTLRRLVEKERPEKIISVGDIVSGTMIKGGIYPQISVVDNRVSREPVEPFRMEVDRTLHVKNPPGVLTEEAWDVMKKALRLDGVTRVLVDGEEDLFTMVAVLCAPKNSLVVYGQPGKGVVAVKVTEKTIGRVRHVVDAMEVC